MKSFVITIMSMEESVRCADRCIKTAKKHGTTVEYFDAVTPKDDPESFLKNEGVPLEGFKGIYSRWQNVLSCFSSHYTLWKECAEGKEDYLIFEHDAVVLDKIPKLHYRGLISFGQPSYGSYKTPPSFGVNKLISKQYFPGAHAYMIKPRAAQVVIERAKRDACPTDVFLGNDRFDFLEEYYPWPVVVKDHFTTVQKDAGCQAKHSYRKMGAEYKLIKV